MRKVGIVANLRKKEVENILKDLIKYLEKRKKEIFLEESIPIVYKNKFTKANIPSDLDLLIVLGGDGTILDISHNIYFPIPVIGINVGSLGFLTEILSSEMFEKLDQIFDKKNFFIEKRMRLKVKILEDNNIVNLPSALNEIAIGRSSNLRIVCIKVYINGNYFLEFRGDGIIISTPTGSTGYSLSAGGPIIYPTIRVITLTPICVHLLFTRSIILPENSLIEIISYAKDQHPILSIDGQIFINLRENAKVKIQSEDKDFLFLRLKDKTHFETYRKKFNWK